MKVYWSDREGNSPPPHAKFQCRPFFPNAPLSFQGNSQRIENLPSPVSLKVINRTFLPEKEQWISAVEKALSKKMQKVVLARCQILELEKSPDPFALTAALKKKAEGAYVFCFSEGDISFFGGSPERLFFRKGQTIYSEAMAGTRPRSENLAVDTKLGRDLMESAKDLRELTPVQTFLKTALDSQCQEPLSFSPISLYKTQNVQHLYTRCTGTLKKNIDDEEILSLLHPTPALCGTPTKEAFDLIRTLEPFDRGLYGGALGWSTPESSEWIVGIRSCFIRGNLAYLYAGTGIVEGSDPEEEWEELNQKGRLYDGIFL
jgi:menaquinone-specific isochorismate synthase